MLFNIILNMRIIISIIGKSFALIFRRYKNYLVHVGTLCFQKWYARLLARLWPQEAPDAGCPGGYVEPPKTGATLTRFRLPFQTL